MTRTGSLVIVVLLLLGALREAVANDVRTTEEIVSVLRNEGRLHIPCIARMRTLEAEKSALLDVVAAHPHQQYDHPENGFGPYGTGCADGHRCAADLVRAWQARGKL